MAKNGMKSANPQTWSEWSLDVVRGVPSWPAKAKNAAGVLIVKVLGNPWLPLMAVLFAMAYSVNDTVAGVKATMPIFMHGTAWRIVLSFEVAVLLALALMIFHPTIKILTNKDPNDTTIHTAIGNVESKGKKVIRFAYVCIVGAAMRFYLFGGEHVGDNGIVEVYKGAFADVVWAFEPKIIASLFSVALGAALHAAPSFIGFYMEDILMQIPDVKAFIEYKRAIGLQKITNAETNMSMAVGLAVAIKKVVRTKVDGLLGDPDLEKRIAKGLGTALKNVTDPKALQKLLGGGKG